MPCRVSLGLRAVLIAMLTIAGVFLASFLILAREQQQLTLQDSEAQQIHFAEYSKVVDRRFLQVRDHAEMLQREVEYRYSRPELTLSEDEQKVYDLMAEMEKGFHAGNLTEQQKHQVGALNGVGSFRNRSDTFYRELKVLLQLSRSFRHTYESVPSLTWVHSFTQNRIAKIYPWISSDQLHIKDLEVLIYETSGPDSEEWYWRARPSLNPERKVQWSKAYHDGFGKGIMTTAFAPVYDGDRFAGTIGLDRWMISTRSCMTSPRRTTGP